MNRNSLLEVSKKILNDNKEFKAPLETKFNLPGKEVLKKIKYEKRSEYILRPDFINSFKMLN